MQRTFCLLPFALLAVGSAPAAHAATPASLPTATIATPTSDMPGVGLAVSDTHLAYILPDPVLRPRGRTKTNVFSTFHDRVFLVPLHMRGGRLIAGQARVLLTGARARVLSLISISDDWLVYSQYSSDSLDVDVPWSLMARNVRTQRAVILDTSAREGLGGIPPDAASDGQTVVWRSRTLVHGEQTWVIRAYTFATGRSRIVVRGGTPTTFAYGLPGVSGRYVVYEQEWSHGPAPRAQIWLSDLATGQRQALTSAQDANSEPAIAGDVVVWKVGWRYAGGQGLGLYNMRTGVRKTLTEAGLEQPVLTVNYAIYSFNIPTIVRLYNTQTGVQTSLAGADGHEPGDMVFAGEQTVAYTTGGPSLTTVRLVVVRT